MSKSQINLPKTAFSMKANLPTREPEILKLWQNINLYDELRKSRKGEEKFVLHDGPPYANGNIHMGTALNKILKDIIVRFHQMDGKDSVYVPGWDCHGLPIEWKIEEQYKKNKKNKNEVPIVEFRKECRAFAEKWIDVHKDQFKRLGVVGDWDNYYSTMSFDAEAQIVRELGKFLKEGSLYRGFKPVLWSTVEKTALADAEVEYQDHRSDTIYASFPIKSSNIKELNDSEIVIWTTTPWTIPANKALAYNESLDYLLIEVNDDGDFKNKKIVIADALIDTVVKDTKIQSFKKLKNFKGKDLKGTICNHPFLKLGYEYDIPMLEARFVTTEQGTGIVHCAPSHGPDDFNLCMNNGIKAIETVDGDGRYTKNVALFEGMHIFKSNSIVIEKLKDQKKLLSSGELVHSYPHSWRSKAPLVHRATPQWFISMDSHKLRNKALKAIDETTFYPSKGKERLKSMIETRPDWCVSRQRVWGVPLPIFINKKTGEILVDDEVFENIAKIYEKEGSDCWFSDNPQKFLGKKYKAEDFEKLSDIVEVWFDSGSTHSFVLEKRKDLKWPASMYLEGSDQHRGWFHSSLLESCGTRDRAPFESILSHGFVVDGKGLKMSKSLGNVIAPEDILKKYGADILRIWVASSNYAEDLRIDYSILDQHAESYRKIRNTFRYLLGNLNDNFEQIDLEKIKIENLPELEQFMLHKIYNLNSKFNKYFKDYDFHNLYKELLNFCTVDLSAFYFDIRKDTLYCDPLNSEKRKSTLILLNVILNSLLRWFAPILSFTTEEIYQLISKNKKSIHLEKFLNFPEKFDNSNLNSKWEQLIKIRDICNLSIEQKRASKDIGSSLEAALIVKLNNENQKFLKNIDLSELCITSSVKIENGDTNEIIVETSKATGEKCPICWKIRSAPCERPNCK
ncbi:isoleucine--tRNA ligase [Candidatus Pelagibacter sp. RS39]|uniref:isoleucine--tRNA ligase n=1 Tax=Candidatus Pelagibacter sp. RS39 TaxID=1977864 RepID=UPI000A16B3AD|nr:isoleucine--tRNA ligase [Candidatus Pelagibacter sp. RS39]ARJ48316.1 isoleucine--tRNA ligase [Candidatus Pelagibacter sp. RS39]